MKIAVVHSFYQSSFPSGETISVGLEVKALQDAGHDVQLFAKFTDDLLHQRIYPLRAALTVASGRGPSPLEAIREFAPDIIHVQNLFPNWSTAWVRNINIPYVVTVRNFRLLCPAGTLMRNGKFCDLCPTSGVRHSVIHSCYKGSKVATLPLAVSVARNTRPDVLENASGVIFLSKRSQKIFSDYGLVYEEKAQIVPSFVLPDSGGPYNDGVGRDARWIFVGRLSAEKGILQLIKHWPQGRSLDVVGSGELSDECVQVAKGKDIHFHGQLEQDTIREMLRRAKGLVFPSVCMETLGRVYLEAVSVGCPVAALVGNTVADDVEESGSGVVFTNFADILWGLDEVESNEDTYRRKASARYIERFSPASWLQSITRVYSDAREAN